MNRHIYLDNNATTFIDPRVATAIYEFLNKPLGNPSSVHSFGRGAREALQNARRQIASYLSVKPHEIIFTSGGTESLNLTIRGFLQMSSLGHVITSSIEHASVFTTLQRMQAQGWDVEYLNPGLKGHVSPDQLLGSIRPNTKLICLMAANNETGVKFDIEGLAAIARKYQIPMIVDGVSLLGKEVFKIPLGVSAMCFSGHKIHAPAGIGFAYIQNTLRLSSQLTGGDQEFQRRGGTENLAGIIGLAEAVKILDEVLLESSLKMKRLRDYLERSLIEVIPGVIVNGSSSRIANTSNLSFSGIDGEALLMALDLEGIAVSHGSACSSGALEPSRVLLNMGISRQMARSSLRISLSRFTTEKEIEKTITIFKKVVSKLNFKHPAI